jgi:hypothetical protein
MVSRQMSRARLMVTRCEPVACRQQVHSHASQACQSGVHCSAASLHATCWRDVAESIQQAVSAGIGSEESLIVDVPHGAVVGPVEHPQGDDFPGIFSATLTATLLPPHPFLGAALAIGRPIIGFFVCSLSKGFPCDALDRGCTW